MNDLRERLRRVCMDMDRVEWLRLAKFIKEFGA